MAHINLTHLHKRKRQHDKSLEPYPHPKLGMRVLDVATMLTGVIGPLTILPQIIEVWVARSASGVSVISWAAFALFDIPFMVYAVVHKETPVFVTYTLFFIANTLVVIGAVIYG